MAAGRRRSQRELLLDLLLAVGKDGAQSSTLAREVGTRFGSSVQRLRAEGYEISCDPAGAFLSGEHLYALQRLPDGSEPLPAPIPAFEATSLSARRAYLVIRDSLRRGDAASLALVRALLRAQPDLLASRSLRHNLAGRVLALDELGRDVGLQPPTN